MRDIEKMGCHLLFQNINILTVFEPWTFLDSGLGYFSKIAYAVHSNFAYNKIAEPAVADRHTSTIFLWAGMAKSPKCDPPAVYAPGSTSGEHLLRSTLVPLLGFMCDLLNVVLGPGTTTGTTGSTTGSTSASARSCTTGELGLRVEKTPLSKT